MKSIQILFLLMLNAVFLRVTAQSTAYQFSTLNFSNGLSNNHITSLYRDARGFIWCGTMEGLNRYDGYEFRVFKHDQKDPHSIGDNYIEKIFEGPEGQMWVQSRSSQFNIYDLVTEQFHRDYAAYLRQRGLPEFWLLGITRGAKGYWFIYRDSGVFHYDLAGKTIPIRQDSTRPGCLSTAPISDAREDRDGNCWVIHQNGLLEKIDANSHTVTFRTPIMQKAFGLNLFAGSLYFDNENDLWIYSSGYFKGAYCYTPSTGALRHFSTEAGPARLSSDVVFTVLQDEKGKIWLATDHGGVDVLDKKDGSVTTLEHIEDDRKSLAENSIPAMFRDSTGTIWMGTFKSGVIYYHPNGVRFPLFRHQRKDPSSLSFDDVNKFVEDTAGNVWIGSNGGGLIYFDRKHHRFRQYRHDPANPNSLSNDIIVSLLVDKDNKLWIGTYFGGLDCYDGNRFVHYRHDDRQPGSLAEDRIMCLYEDSEKNLWVGTLAAGLDRFDRKTNSFEHYDSTRPNSIQNNYVSCVLEDARKNLWVATAFGIDVLEKSTGRFVHLSSENNQLSNDNVIQLFLDSRQHMWVATREGLNLFLPDKKIFQSFRTDNGLSDNTIRCILEDSQHELWVSTANGLSRIQITGTANLAGPVSIRCRSYHEQDGLQGREFNERTGLTTRDGYILFGGANGFNLFRPEQIINTGKAPPIVLTGLEIFNKPVRVGEQLGGRVILDHSLAETREITLTHSQDVFSIEFASLDFFDNPGNKYAYTLEGFNKNWLVTDGKNRKATYTNLDAGEYTFKVKSSDEDGQWYDRVATLKIVILPPFWQTPLAYVVYALLLIGVLLLARRMVIKKARIRFMLEQERAETRRMHEMDMMKIRFFTNMSHELRTPLSLILAPVEKLMAGHQVSDPKKQYEVIRRNARRLLHLVNQLLDFRKMETNELKLHPRQGDILNFIREISYSFIDLAERRNISFDYHCDSESLPTAFDHDKIERILFNLLSNAFKFTPTGGAVSVAVSTEYQADAGTLTTCQPGTVLLYIRVKDTGIGIPPDQQQRIFDRFFQSETPNNILNQGSGIGLAITQEFVKMHQGKLSVESELNRGSCFTVRLPFLPSGDFSLITATPAKTAEAPTAFTETTEASTTSAETADAPIYLQTLDTGAKKSTILIVEDNEDFRFYLKDNLRSHYSIIEATDGKEGWRKALAEHPDLIVSDISMPLMNGIDLCKKILADERTCQIPVILLTAMSGEGAELKGLQTGAIDYIIKPFNFELLLSKIRNVLAHNDTVKKTYQRQVQAAPAAIQIESADEVFVRNVLEVIEKNMGNPEFSVRELSIQFHASRSTFYKRVLLLTGKTPIEFIRHIRLKRAAELLEKSQLTVSEIAYTVGFNNPKNFSQYFKMEFDRIPSAYRSEKKNIVH
jgi:signal transduction histidine kinase/ligand-binding sensor domain-containing protein/DNA-binding response OmpR family regulator